MPEYKIDPPLRLVGRPNITVHSLDEAADFIRHHKGASRPMSQQHVLRQLEGAGTLEQQKDAAVAFRGWAEAEGLLIA
jgi:hypothetical protein